MIEVFLTLILATITGLLAGLLPGIGSAALMLTSLPFLYLLPPELCIIYFALGIQSSQFSGSVSAINFGMIGEVTSYPALSERYYILKNNLQLIALKFTAIGSILSCIVPIIFFYPLLKLFEHQDLIMRTEFTFLVIMIIIVFCVLYKGNSKSMNIFLVSVGILIAQIGLSGQGSAEKNFLTFNQPFLYGGIPMMAVLGGLISMPLIVKYMGWDGKTSMIKLNVAEQKIKFPIWSSVRGGLLGLFAGVIPAVGTSISSNLAWRVEKIFFPKDNHKSVISRLTSAESANNASQITVLIPLLLLGIAIIPSEMILLSVLETKSWVPGQSSWTLMSLNFYEWLLISLIISSIICYIACYTFIRSISKWIGKNLNVINKFCILIMSISVFYMGSLVEARMFFMSCFFIFSLIGILFKKINFIPLVVGYFIGDILMDTITVLSFMYG